MAKRRKSGNDMELTEVYAEKAALLRALSHPVRLCIVRNLLEGRCNVGHMQDCLGIPQSTLSQHLAILRMRGIIKPEKLGTETFYRVTDTDAKVLAMLLVPARNADPSGRESK